MTLLCCGVKIGSAVWCRVPGFLRGVRINLRGGEERLVLTTKSGNTSVQVRLFEREKARERSFYG